MKLKVQLEGENEQKRAELEVMIGECERIIKEMEAEKTKTAAEVEVVVKDSA